MNNPTSRIDPDGNMSLLPVANFALDIAAQLEADRSGMAERAVQGAVTGTGAMLLNDGIRRGQYQQAASQLAGEGASDPRKALARATNSKLSPIGQALTRQARAARKGQLAGKTAVQLAESAPRTNPSWNVAGKAGKVAGVAGLVVGAGIAVNNISSAPEGQRGAVAAGEIGALGGGFAGAYAGAEIGAVIGSVFPGAGTAIGAVVGGLIGGGVGAIIGGDIGTDAYESLVENR